MKDQAGKNEDSLVRAAWLLPVVLAAGVWVYLPGMSGPFIFDDLASITENPHLRHLWPPWEAITGPPETTVSGRPVVALSLAVNYAITALDVRAYHAFNLITHLLSTLLLYGLVRRTLRGQDFGGGVAAWLALVAAALWMIHPLQTDAVTYVIQRTELLMGFFYLLTLYCAVRGWDSTSPGRWFAAAVGACALGMGCKEVMVSAPLVVLLYDRVFRSGLLAEAWRRGLTLYVGLASTWIIMAVVLVSGPRAGTVGFGHGTSSLSYLQTQAGVIIWYLRLCFWPDPLVIDYAWPLAVAPAAWILPGMSVLVLLALTVWGLIRRSWWGFLAAWFFLILAPTSSFVPIVTEPAAERRMYLPLAAVVVLVVIGGWWAWQKLCAGMPRQGRVVPLGAVGLAVVVAALLGYGTAGRNEDYRSALAIWQDTVTKRPHHAAARLKLANLLFEAEQLDEAARNYQRILETKPLSAETHYNLANVHAARGRFDDAITHYNEALQLNPRYAEAHNNLGRLLVVRGRYDPALSHFSEALDIDPDYLAARINTAGILANLGRLDEAVGHFTEALRRDAASVDARMGLADALLDQSRFDRAEAEYGRVLEFNPQHAGAHANLAIALAMRGRKADAIAELQEALQLDPNQPGARRLLADLLAEPDRLGGD